MRPLLNLTNGNSAYRVGNVRRREHELRDNFCRSNYKLSIFDIELQGVCDIIISSLAAVVVGTPAGEKDGSKAVGVAGLESTNWVRVPR
jgi:hypothetical protein